MPPPPPRKIFLRPSFGGEGPPSSIAQDTLANAPQLLPPRTNTLTPPQSAPSRASSTLQSPNPAPSYTPLSHVQAQSPLFHTLPFEIRRLIYLQLLGGESQQVHLVQRPNHIRAIRCWMPEAPDRHGCMGTAVSTGVFVGWLSPSADYGDSGMLEWETRRLGMRVLGLACTCRRIYVEVIPLLYTVPTFVMNSVCTLPWWKDTLLPFRFDSVRSLRLRFLLLPTRQDPDFVQHPESKFSSNAASRLADDMWRNTWNVVAQMIGLRKLRVMLDTMPATVDPAVEMEVLEPLCEVRGIEDYVVLLAWNLDTETISEATKKDMPFRFVRSTGITTN